MNHRVVNMQRLERELSGPDDLLGKDPLGSLRRERPEDYAPPAVRQSQPGVLSAEAVVHQWEIAARSIEAMGDDIRKVAERCESLMTEANGAITFIDETAAYYREQGAKVFSEMEGHALVVAEVRKTCEAIRQKIAGQTSSA